MMTKATTKMMMPSRVKTMALTRLAMGTRFISLASSVVMVAAVTEQWEPGLPRVEALPAAVGDGLKPAPTFGDGDEHLFAPSVVMIAVVDRAIGTGIVADGTRDVVDLIHGVEAPAAILGEGGAADDQKAVQQVEFA